MRRVPVAPVATLLFTTPGAACHADETSVSAVLRAMHVPHEYAVGTLRLSTGRHARLGH